MKVSIYLNRRVFVMHLQNTDPDHPAQWHTSHSSRKDDFLSLKRIISLVIPYHTIVVEYYGFTLVLVHLADPHSSIICSYFCFQMKTRVNVNGILPNLGCALIF